MWRRLPPLEHAVVADDADAPMPKRRRHRRVWLECRGGVSVPPRGEQYELSGIVDALEQLMVDQAAFHAIEAELRGHTIRREGRAVGVGGDLGQGYGLGVTGLGCVETLLRDRQA